MASTLEPRTATLGPEQSAALGQRLGDAPWLASLRARAAREALGRLMPSPMERPWKYLDISKLDLDGFAPPTPPLSPGDISSRVDLGGNSAAVLFEQDGAIALAAGDGLAGATVAGFRQLPDNLSAVLEQRLGSAVPFDRSKLTALHYAFLTSGVLVHVPANAEVTRPVRIVRAYGQANTLATPHTLIVTGANSRVHVIEEYQSSEDAIVALPAVEILPGEGSEVRYTVLHRWGAKTRVYGEQRTVTEKDSAVISLSLAASGQAVKSHIESSLVGRGSSSELFGLGVGRGREHADFFTLQDHIGPDTRSDLLFKFALKDQSRAVYYGLTRVGLGAKNADANQENRNLLLSREARADSDPVLEILTHDIIRASHGATAGPVDEEQLFYLQARGIPYAAAESLLVKGFLGQVLDRVQDEQLRLELESSVEAQLEA